MWRLHSALWPSVGARVSGEILQTAHQLGIPAYEGCGISECGSVVSMNTPLQFQPGSAGKVLPHVQVKIADDGEVLVKDALALGYLGQPFVEDWLPTGDLGELDAQGFLSIQGRKKNQIITSFGRNISPEWIESEAQRWGAIRNLIVVGESRDRLSGVVLTQDPAAAVTEIGELNTTLPDYARIGQLTFVKDPQAYLALLTANHRPRREMVEQQVNQWLADPEQYQHVVGVVEL
ncbi:AMP-binding protein [Vibrio sp. PP-XX7]